MHRPASWCSISTIALVSFLLALAASPQAHAQSPASQATGPRVTVHVTCAPCDVPSLRGALTFVEFLDTPDGADVLVVITSRDVDQTREWRVAITGRGRFASRDRAILVPVATDAPLADVRTQLTRVMRLGLTEFAADGEAGAKADVTYARQTGTTLSPHDPWNYWVFRLGAHTYGNGEEQTFEGYYEVSASANRTTEDWKVRLSGNRGLSRSSFRIDETETIKTRLSDFSTDVLIVRSLGARLSGGLAGSMNGSTYSNTERAMRLTPAIEFDFFPYSESTKRSLTVQYDIGVAHYNYFEPTIFDRLEETVAQHGVGMSLGLDQPWGAVGSEFIFTQQLSAPERTRMSFSGNFNVRLFKSLSFNGSGGYSRIRDQFTLEKGEASPDEVLLRQRQLETGYRYSMSFGISYSFGALSNATVNPRFNN